MARAFSVEAPFRLSSAATDCWDQVAKFGEFVKDDGDGPQLATFNLQHLGEFMTNFARQVNPLWADNNHDFGDANARYDALALVVDGTPIRVTQRSGDASDVPPPLPAQLVNPNSGAIEDGLYAHRYELTPLGQQKLPNVSYVSPLFLTNGKDEQGQDIGYVLLNIAWTNGPFLDGMAPLKMVRLPLTSFAGVSTMNEYLKRYGVDDAATPDQLHAAMKKYADEMDGADQRRTSEMARYRRFADAIGGDEEFTKFLDDPDAMSRFRRFMDGDDKDDKPKSDDDKAEMSAMARLLGVAPKLSAIRAKLTEMHFTHAPKTEVAALKSQLAELAAKEAKRDEAEREVAEVAFARAAIADRAWDPDDESGLIAFHKASPKAAFDAVEKNKKLKTWDRVIAMQRLTSGGSPIGKPEGAPLNLMGDEQGDIEHRVDEAVQKIARDEKVSYSVAMTRVKTVHPELYARYRAAR